MQKKTVRRIETDPGDPINFGAARWWLFYSAERQPFATIDKKFPKKKHCRSEKKLDLRAVEILDAARRCRPESDFFCGLHTGKITDPTSGQAVTPPRFCIKNLNASHRVFSLNVQILMYYERETTDSRRDGNDQPI